MSLSGELTFAENVFIKPASRWPEPVAPATEPATVRIAVVGLGYVGAPLAVAFSRHFAVSGLDIDVSRVAELSDGRDRTNELSSNELLDTGARFTTDAAVLGQADVIVVTVPTPVDHARVPDLNPVMQASISVGKNMKRGATVVYESTVYPGVTEEICIPLLERHSGLKHLKDFHVGYSRSQAHLI